ncbi:MAG: leucine-rich repeat protein [Promethearchaeota archaeon]
MSQDYVIINGERREVENVLYAEDSNLDSITQIERLDKCVNLLNLSLSFNQIKEIDGLENLKELVFLELSHNHINEIKGLDELKNLKELSLHTNHIRTIEGLDWLSQLEYLDLRSNHIEKIENLENLSNLKVLLLSNNEIQKIEGLDNLKNLEKLVLGHPMGDHHSKKITKIENLDNLRNLRHLEIWEESITKYENLSNLKNLKSLTISPFYRGSIKEISGLEHLVNLEEINVEDFSFETEEIPNYNFVVLFRFASMVKIENFMEIEDWEKIFKEFPNTFLRFKLFNPEERVEWYLKQCGQDFLKILEDILNIPKFELIRQGQEGDWTEVHECAKKVLI